MKLAASEYAVGDQPGCDALGALGLMSDTTMAIPFVVPGRDPQSPDRIPDPKPPEMLANNYPAVWALKPSMHLAPPPLRATASELPQ